MFVAGAGAGGYLAWQETVEIMAGMMADFGTTTAEAGVATHVGVLERLRGGKTAEAFESLELLLDGDILSLANPAHVQLSERSTKILSRAREYRRQFPHTTANPSVDAAVQAALERGK
jgi:hypothetical protein